MEGFYAAIINEQKINVVEAIKKNIISQQTILDEKINNLKNNIAIEYVNYEISKRMYIKGFKDYEEKMNIHEKKWVASIKEYENEIKKINVEKSELEKKIQIVEELEKEFIS